MAGNNDNRGGNRNHGGNRSDQGASAGGRQASAGGSGRDQRSGSMSVREAGHKGGQRVSELVEKGKQRE